jgi:hypothetical protein
MFARYSWFFFFSEVPVHEFGVFFPMKLSFFLHAFKLFTFCLSKMKPKEDSWLQVLELTSGILTTWEAEIGRIVVQGQPGQIVCETPSPK